MEFQHQDRLLVKLVWQGPGQYRRPKHYQEWLNRLPWDWDWWIKELPWWQNHPIEGRWSWRFFPRRSQWLFSWQQRCRRDWFSWDVSWKEFIKINNVQINNLSFWIEQTIRCKIISKICHKFKRFQRRASSLSRSKLRTPFATIPQSNFSGDSTDPETTLLITFNVHFDSFSG